MPNFTRIDRVLLVLFVTITAPSALFAATATASWDPNPETNVAGYKLSYGTQTRIYTIVVDVGNVTTAVVNNLQAGVRYYFAVQAYDTVGVLSAYSTEVVFDVPGGSAPAISGISPASGPVGSIVTIAGTGFGSTAGSVTFNGVDAGSPASWSSTSIS